MRRAGIDAQRTRGNYDSVKRNRDGGAPKLDPALGGDDVGEEEARDQRDGGEDHAEGGLDGGNDLGIEQR